MAAMAAAVPVPVLVRPDPAVAEAAVRAVLSAAGPAVFEAHRLRSDPLYEIVDPAARDAAFAALAVAEFGELALAAPLLTAIAERPVLAGSVHVLLIGQAGGRHDEGVTCEPAGQHLGVRIDPERFARRAELLHWARHAMGHAEDTLDPSFGFERGWDEGPGARGTAAASRLHRLWDVTVDSRLAAAGHVPSAVARARHRDVLAADLPDVTPAIIEAALARLWGGPRPAFGELAAWAARPASLVLTVAPGAGSLPRPDRCPLCGFPAGDVVPPDPVLAGAVTHDYPAWRPELGLCGRCADRYRFATRLGGRA